MFFLSASVFEGGCGNIAAMLSCSPFFSLMVDVPLVLVGVVAFGVLIFSCGRTGADPVLEDDLARLTRVVELGSAVR